MESMARKLSPLLLVLTTLLVYSGVQRHKFVDYDDPLYVTDNYRVRQGLSWENVGWAFAAFEVGNWHPLTWLSHMTDWTLFGPNPAGHHWMSVTLHALNSGLLFLLLHQLTGLGRASFVAAALFALHPLNVESVAWVAERKNVLSLFLALGSALFYVRYVRLQSRLSYFGSMVLFGAALMAKPMVVTLPCLFLLLDLWPLERTKDRWTLTKPRRQARHNASSGIFLAKRLEESHFPQAMGWLLLEKAPLLLLSLFSSLLTLHAQSRSGDVMGLDLLPLALRLKNAAVAYISYIGKFIWPSRLSVFYPYNISVVPRWQILGAMLILTGISVAVILQYRRRRYLAVGWFWFLGAGFPTIGIVQSGGQALADRYMYLPMIGLVIMIVWTIEEVISKVAAARLIWPVLVGVPLLILATLTVRQVNVWADDHTLFMNALEVTENNHVALGHLGNASLREGKTDEAVRYFEKAIAVNQGRDAISHHHLALVMQSLSSAYLQAGQQDQALTWIQKALRINPHSPSALQDLALVLTGAGKDPEALATIRQALQQPAPPSLISDMLVNQGTILSKMNRTVEALQSFEEAVAYNPTNVQAYINLGALLLVERRFDEAVSSLQNANSIHPTASAYFLLGMISSNRGQEAEAIQLFRQSLSLDPNHAKARQHLILLLGKTNMQPNGEQMSK